MPEINLSTRRSALPTLHRNLNLRASTFDDGTNTIDVVWTTGADVLRSGLLDGTFIERLATGPNNVRLDRLNAGAPFLDSHNAYDLAGIIGSVVPGSARMLDGRGLATIRLSSAPGSADVVQNIRDGVIRNISAGYVVHSFERTEARDGSPAVMLATDWEPVELSAVPVPADPGAQFRSRSAERLHHVEITTMTKPMGEHETSVRHWAKVMRKEPDEAFLRSARMMDEREATRAIDEEVEATRRAERESERQAGEQSARRYFGR